MNVSLLLSLKNATDPQIIEWARQHQIELSRSEVKELRSILKQASIDWLITGIPKNVMQQLEGTVGKKKFKQLQHLLNFSE